MKKPTLLLLTVFMVLIGFGAIGQEQEPAQPKADEQARSSGEELLHELPPLSKEEEEQLAKALSDLPDCPGPAPLPLAVSVSGRDHDTAGMDVLLTYQETKTNEGGAWLPGNTTFAVLCDGLYSFSITFVKDFVPGEDVDVSIRLEKGSGGSVLRDTIGKALAGEGGGKRATGAYNVILRLKRGDYLQTWVSSGNRRPRYLLDYNFTAHRIGN